ncbi:MAG: hypothetical protein Q9197_003398 [Variospora fuerteventurae]
MSIFSKIKGAKKAAEKHKQAKASEIPVEKKDAPVPYRHIPTHAAADALTGTPSSWREEDRAAIQHHHKRRSMMNRNSSMISGTLHPSSSYTGSDFSNGIGPAASSSRPSPTRLETRKSYQGTGHYQPSPLGSNALAPFIESFSARTSPVSHGQHTAQHDTETRRGTAAQHTSFEGPTCHGPGRRSYSSQP